MSNTKPDRDDRENQPENQEDQNVHDQSAGNAEEEDDWGTDDASDAEETGDNENDDDAGWRADRDGTASLHHRQATAEPPSNQGDQPGFDDLMTDDLEEEAKAEKAKAEKAQVEEAEADEDKDDGEDEDEDDDEDEHGEDDDESEDDEGEVSKSPRNQNAVTHGAFAQDHLRDEDPEEFERLCQSIRDDWTADGATQEQSALLLARAFRAVARLDRFAQEELTLAAESPRQSEVNSIADLAEMLKTTRHEIVASRIVGLLPDAVRQFLNANYPRSNFENARQWIAALTSAMPSILEVHTTAAVRERSDLTWRIGQAARMSDVFEKIIKLYDRLDACIDKRIRRLIELKTHIRVTRAD